jgi:hypothetical protein
MNPLDQLRRMAEIQRPAGVSKNSFVPSGDFLNGPVGPQPRMRDPVRQSMPEMGAY